MHRALIGLLCAITLGIAATAALGASPHYKSGTTAQFTFSNTTMVMTVTGTISGLGNQDLKITLIAVATGDVRCGAPGSDNPAGGQQTRFTLSGSVTIPATEIKNGNLTFSVSAGPPAPTCQNPNWHASITNFTFVSGALDIQQPVGTALTTLSRSCTVSGSTCT